ncbi:flagellin [Pararhizobium capsulatum DSM 1112]|uniref:Flagellin n=1 Tax=Pararhizobium capsulatum DSM 1112 TaxID=1121113 RepID=A0ABU0BM56_9HYPH|nr:flagellin [Pararhizobium capsulatum]MDQ0319330.1 flagellin [Pararhizobium capsulatum DSM 1112]
MTDMSFNAAATAALAILRHNDTTAAKQQDMVTTGLRISEAADNAAYWSIATDMRNTNKATSTVIDALELGAALVDVGYQAMENVVDITSEIKDKLVLMKDQSVDRYKVSAEVYELQKQFLSVTESASFNGRNLLAPGKLNYTEKSYVDANGVTLNYIEMGPPDTNLVFGGIVSNYTKGKIGLINVYDYMNLNVFGQANYKNENGGLTLMDGLADVPDVNGLSGGVTNADPSKTTAWLPAFNGHTAVSFNHAGHTDDTFSAAHMGEVPDDLVGYATDLLISRYDEIEQKLTDRAATIGSLSMRIEIQTDFNRTLSDTITKGVGRLVDADMNTASMKLKAVQAQVQLAVQALNIANNSPSLLMQLFR